MSLLALLQVACLVIVAILLVAAGTQDWRTMHIANGFSLAISALFAIWAVAGMASGNLSLTAMAMAVACASGAFAASAVAFAAGALGGGDVKLLAAVSLFAGPTRILDFLAVTALVGGLLGIAIVAGVPIGRSAMADGATLRTRLRGGLPYGPAIAAGGLWVAVSLGSS